MPPTKARSFSWRSGIRPQSTLNRHQRRRLEENPPVPRCRGPGLRDGAAAKAESRRIPGRSPKVHDQDVHRVLKAINFDLAAQHLQPVTKRPLPQGISNTVENPT